MKEKLKKIVNNKYIKTTYLCLLTYGLYLNMMQIYPFGEYSILKCDLYQQYINFFCYLKEVIINGKSLVISWNLGLANYFYTTFAYYLISPLNLFVVFFSYSNMDIFVEIITGIKIILMANFFVLFLEKSYNYKYKENIFFGIIYAFSSYVICYSFHIMWLDCVYMLPIILLFVDKYIENGKIYPLIICLTYAILTNYYIGYIVALFSGIYFLVKIYTNKKSIKLVFKFLLAIFISFGIGMIVILPSLMQLKGKMNTNSPLIEIDLNKIRLFINVIFNNYVYMFTQKSCFVFSSTLIILLLPMYYLNKKILLKEKIAFTLIILFLLLPIISPFFNKLWHAFTLPNCFNYRYSFTLILVLILMGAREFQNRDYTKKWHFLLSIGIFILLNMIEIVFLKEGYLESDNYSVVLSSIGLSCFIYCLITIIIYFYFYNKKAKRSAFVLLLVITILDILIGAKSGQNNNDKYFKRDTVKQYDKFMEYFIPKLENPEFERIFFEPDEYGSNMSLKYGYSNMGFFSSARNRETLKAMYRLGYNVQMDEQLWITSYSGTFLNYNLAGVKYYITKNQIEDNEIYGFEFLEKYDDLYIYKNKNTFNIGYYLAENIEQSYNPFKMQNELLDGLTNKKNENKKEKEKIKEKYFQNIENSDVLECNKTIVFDEKNQEYKIKYNVIAKKDCNIYIASDYDLQVYIDNKPIFQNYSNIWSTETGIKQIKYLKKDEELEFTIVTKQDLDLLYIYISNKEEIQKVLDNREDITNIEIKNNGLSGMTNFKEEGYLVLSIAYDKCWKIYVDGKETKSEAIAGAFLGVKIKKGEHIIRIKSSFFP